MLRCQGNGLTMPYSVIRGRTALPTTITAQAATSRAGAARQRRDGSRPSGKIAMAANPAIDTTQVQPSAQAAQPAPAAGPRWAR
jgi:hypothetical protein